MKKEMNHSKIIFDYEKCLKCGLCSKVCGSFVIRLNEGMPLALHEGGCCSCGHCAAICPVDAVTSARVENQRSFKTIVIDSNLDPIEKLIKGKRSVRAFKNETPDKNVIKKIIEYAEKAPSSNNNRHREYFVVKGQEKIDEIEKTVVMHFIKLGKMINPVTVGVTKFFSKKLGNKLSVLKTDLKNIEKMYYAGERPVFKKAPVLIFIIAPKKDIQAKDDCIIAQQYMMLYSESVGIGSCINGYAQIAHKQVEKLLNIPSAYTIYSAGVFGYIKHQCKKEVIYDNEIGITWM